VQISGTGSPVKVLIDTVARQTIENNAQFQAFMTETNQKISEFTDPQKVPVLAEISAELTEILIKYYRDSAIRATWKPIESIQPSFPTSDLEVTDNEFVTNIDGVGHGLQRAIILTVLQFIAERRAKAQAEGDGFDEAQSDIIIAIEEPEIYQHPIKQRLFAKLLQSLAQAFNKQTGIRIQTIYVTHSPLLVSLGACESIRMVRARRINEKRNVDVCEISLDRCAKHCAQVSGRKPEEAWSAAQFGAKLHTFRSEIAEGFFGKCVVLVEGVGDKAILEAWYRHKERDPHAEGIVICEVSGKANLDKPIAVFSELQIERFWIFDNDKSDNKKEMADRIKLNKILQRLGDIADAQCVDWPEGIFERFFSWDSTIEKYVKNIAGVQEFDAAAKEMAVHFDIEPATCIKFPASASAMLSRFSATGHEFRALDDILSAVDKLLAA
jgi:hypothetical protein